MATLVVCTPGGEVFGQLAPFQAALPWWQDAETLVRGARELYGVDVTILRLLEATRPAPPGGSVTYLAEVEEARARGLPLAPWVGVLDQHPLRLPYAEPGGPARDLAWAVAALEELGYRRDGEAQQVRTWNLSSRHCCVERSRDPITANLAAQRHATARGPSSAPPFPA